MRRDLRDLNRLAVLEVEIRNLIAYAELNALACRDAIGDDANAQIASRKPCDT